MGTAPAPILPLCLLLLASGAGAVELTLDTVIATGSGGDVNLRLDSRRASFDFDPATGTLLSAGTWIAEYGLPNGLTRFGHKVEDLRVSPDGQITVRSYECVEGAFGAVFLEASLCGNYRFGPNGLDDGGLVDDVVVAAPRSFDRYRVSNLEWDGHELRLTLSAGSLAEVDPLPVQDLTLVLRARSGTDRR